MSANVIASTPIETASTESGSAQPADHRRVRVMLLTSSLERGGAERQVVELANNLDKRLFDVTVCSLSPDVPLAEHLHDAAQRLLIVPKQRKYDLGLVRRVARLMRHRRIDVVHSFMFDAEMVGRLAGRVARVPAVICSNRCPHLSRSKFKLRLARWTRSCFDLMVANSHAGLEFERDRQHVPEGKLCVIPNGVDTHRFRPGRADHLRKECQLGCDDIVVGMVAHFRSNKDHATLVRAAARLVEDHPQARFVLLGKPDGDSGYYAQAQALASQLGIEDYMRFAGNRENVADWYRCFDIKVLSTRFEGTPNVVLEAMASGLPVVASDVCDNSRIIAHGKNGYLVRPADVGALADTLSNLLDDAALRYRIGQAARDHVQAQYSTEALARRTGDAYMQVLRSKGHQVAT